jgi:cell division protein FtsW
MGGSVDLWLVTAIVSLVVFGLIMVYSASNVLALRTFDDSLYFVKRQMIFAVMGLTAMGWIATRPYRIWRDKAPWIFGGCLLLLIAVLIPGVGVVRGGARSWLGLGSFGVQPSEFMKLGLVLLFARQFAKQVEPLRSFRNGLLPALLVLGLVYGLIMLQPDFGTATVLAGACVIMMIVAGARWVHLLWLGGLGVAGLAGLIAAAPYRLKRITAFLDPWQDPLGAGYQAIQSLYAIGPGGLLGLGYGNSRQKYSYLPEPQTDFIFSIVAEELGFVGGALLIGLFAWLLWRGMRTAVLAPDRFSCLLVTGLCGLLAVQVLINIGVVIGMFPVTGITLPFISYGGSSLTIMLMAFGMVLNISRYTG